MTSALDELRSLALAHPNEPKIHLVLANGLVNATGDFGKHGDLHAMTSGLDELRLLAKAHPTELEIQLELPTALHIQAISDPEHQSSAIAELKTLAWRFPTHDGIQQLAHEHGVSYVQQEIAKKEALERQTLALINARRR